MENLFLEAVKLINPVQLIIIGLIVYYFYTRLDQKIEKLDIKLKDTENRLTQKIETSDKDVRLEIKALNQRIDSLYQLIVSLFKKSA